MRKITPLVLLTLAGLFCASSALAQESSQARRSFAQRLSSLRMGWGEDDKEQDVRVAMDVSASQQRTGSNAAQQGDNHSLMGRLPRLNPGDLLPGDRFTGRASSEESQRRRTTAQLRDGRSDYIRRANSSVGSARARIMRDMRSQSGSQAIPTPKVASRQTTTKTRQATTTASVPSTVTPPHPSSVTKSAAAKTNPTIQAKSAAPRPKASSKPVVLRRSTTSRAGSVLSAAGTAPSNHAAVQPPVAQQAPIMSEDRLRRELLGPVAMRTNGQKSKRADLKTTKSVAAAVAESMTTEAEASTDKDSIEAIINGASEDNASLAVAKKAAPQTESTPMESRGTAAAVAARQPAATSPITEPEAPVAATSSDLGQANAKRRFEGRIEQTVAPRSAPRTDPVWRSGVAVAAETEGNRFRNNGARGDADLLMSQRMPMIVSHVSGPKKIVIGREAIYRVTLANRGAETANQLLTQINVPEWAEVISAKASVGMVEPPKTEEGATQVQWRMTELRAGATQNLDMKIVARQGKPIELGVNWKHSPVGSRTVVEVQEPKLRLAIDGPDNVLFGKPQRYRVTLSNPGTGMAENVVLQVIPPGVTGSKESSRTIGSLQAGEARTIDFEFTAKQAGELMVKAEASAVGDLAEAAEKTVFCRKAELEVDWRGPNQKYSGSPATYYFRVRNPGTATAEGVTVQLGLPAGFDVTKASGAGRSDDAARQVVWNVGSLRPGDDYYMELQGVVGQAGQNQFRMKAADSQRLVDASAVATTEVVAVADLKLDIGDPRGPLPVGRDAVYEVRVRNRGSNSAEHVDIVGLFSEGIDPYKVEGAQASIADGRVTIRTVERIAVGGETVLKIHARALRPGAHIFRAEVLCRDLDIKLAAEETTRFYEEEPIELGQGGAFGSRK